LPVSSSAHALLVGYLSGWRYEQLEGSRRKSFELALHAGTASALALVYRKQVVGTLRGLRPRRLGTLMLAVAPPAFAGYLLEDQIERRLSRPVPTAAGLLAGALGMAVADRRGQRARSAEQAGHADALMLGLAQALALAPGVSRNGATLTVARARGFDSESAQRLSWQVGAPVILGASLLRGLRLARGRAPVQDRQAIVVGFTGAFLSSWLASRLIAPVRPKRSLLPYSLYRAVLAALVLVESSRRRRSRSAAAV
jgi:undecaprenyl-diphosphatase